MKNKDKDTKSENTDAESIIKYIRKEEAFNKSFQLNKREYTSVNFTIYQMSDLVRFCVNDSAILSIDTTFDVCKGLYLTDTSYPNLSLIDNETSVKQ